MRLLVAKGTIIMKYKTVDCSLYDLADWIVESRDATISLFSDKYNPDRTWTAHKCEEDGLKFIGTVTRVFNKIRWRGDIK